MRLFSTDIDGTVYDGPKSARKFRDHWNSLRERTPAPLLTYNSGRSLEDTRALLDDTALPVPDYVITGVGTEIFDFHRECRLDEWQDELAERWDFTSVERIVRDGTDGAEMQPEACQNPFKCSWYWTDKDKEDIDLLSHALRDAGIDAQVVYSSARDLDILPTRANKGNALAWLADRCGVAARGIVVAGDSANDASMFHIEGVSGIVVSNAEPALLDSLGNLEAFRASLPCADGVVEGLEQLAVSPRPAVG